MTEQELLQQLDEISQMLYQNKAQKAMEEVRVLLQTLQDMVKSVAHDEVIEFTMEMLKELVEAYQQQDVLGMADCLQEKATLFVQFYFQQGNGIEKNC